jgi:hypothetical protein
MDAIWHKKRDLDMGINRDKRAIGSRTMADVNIPSLNLIEVAGIQNA